MIGAERKLLLMVVVDVILSVTQAREKEILSVTQAREKEWYETTVIYEVYPRSFKDYNGDGIGDLLGIYEKLDFIQDMGYETIWVQTFYQSPMVDFGYDVSNFTEIEPIFGNMSDFRLLLSSIHARGMKMIIDMFPNHVSVESHWFKKSVNREELFYSDYFVWKDPSGYDKVSQTFLPPNNWLSIFGGSAWEWNPIRHQFYYRRFSASQPDLNFRSPQVRKEIEEVMRFWLDLGVDGFRLDAISHLFEADHFEDEPYKSPELNGSLNYDSQYHIHTYNQKETFDICREWRLLLDEYESNDNKSRILIADSYAPPDNLVRFFGNETHRGVHFPFYSGLSRNFDIESNATHLDEIIHDLYDKLPLFGVAHWMVNNQNTERLVGRTNAEFADAMNMILLLLPGVASVYYGDEICMGQTLMRQNQRRDPYSRKGLTNMKDGSRTPMQWDDSKNAGFSLNKETWLPVNPDYWWKNVARQMDDPYSHLNRMRRLLKLRKSPVIRDGFLDTCVVNDWVYMFVRRLDGHEPVVVVVNLGSETETVWASDCLRYLPKIMDVHTASINSGYRKGESFKIRCIYERLCSELRPKAGVVLTILKDKGNNNGTTKLISLLLLLLSVTLRWIL